MVFSSKNSEHSNEADEGIFGNRIIILMRVKPLRQLTRVEKELVLLNYKLAIVYLYNLAFI